MVSHGRDGLQVAELRVRGAEDGFGMVCFARGEALRSLPLRSLRALVVVAQHCFLRVDQSTFFSFGENTRNIQSVHTLGLTSQDFETN